jgi:hypothetical protein
MMGGDYAGNLDQRPVLAQGCVGLTHHTANSAIVQPVAPGIRQQVLFAQPLTPRAERAESTLAIYQGLGAAIGRPLPIIDITKAAAVLFW